MGITFAWEFNIGHIFTLLGVVVALLAFGHRWAMKLEKAEERATEALKRAELSDKKVEALSAGLSAYREIQAERLVSREVLREVEDRLAHSIDRLGDRLNAFAERIARGSP